MGTNYYKFKSKEHLGKVSSLGKRKGYSFTFNTDTIYSNEDVIDEYDRFIKACDYKKILINAVKFNHINGEFC